VIPRPYARQVAVSREWNRRPVCEMGDRLADGRSFVAAQHL